MLHAAAKSKEPGLIPCLLAAGAGCHLNANAGSVMLTPLMLACSAGNAAAAQHLLEAGAGVGVKADKGATALHVACGEGHSEIVQLLIAAGADMEGVTDDGLNPIDCSFIGGYASVAALLQAAAARRGGRKADAGVVR